MLKNFASEESVFLPPDTKRELIDTKCNRNLEAKKGNKNKKKSAKRKKNVKFVKVRYIKEQTYRNGDYKRKMDTL